MKVAALVLVITGLWAAGPAMGAEAQSIGFEGAKWIWSAHDELSLSSASSAFFRAAVDIPENPPLKSAEILVTCDNLFVLYLNGQAVGESEIDNSAWKQPKRWDQGRSARGFCSATDRLSHLV